MRQKREERVLKAFVLMPFEPEFDKIFSGLIRPSLEGVGYEVKRADSIAHQQNILKDVVRGIADADLVVADLTNVDPNVSYEVGISHTLQRPTVLLTQSIEDIPFDLKSYRVLPYSVRFDEAPHLSQALKEIAEKAKSGSLGFGNPVSDFLPQMRKAEGKMEARTEEREEKEFLDFVMDAKKSLEDIAKCTRRIIKAMQEHTLKIKQRTDEMQKITQSRTPGTAVRIYKMINVIASDLILYGEKLEKERPEFHSAWESFGENSTGLLRTARTRGDENKKSLIRFRAQVNRLRSATRDASEGLRGLREAVGKLKGVSRILNRALGKTLYVLGLLVSDLEAADSYCVKLMTLLDEKIEQEG